jgi:antitoxin HicB
MNDESGAYYFATVAELEGCMSDGESVQEAYSNICEAMEGWIETRLAAGYTVPRPLCETDTVKSAITRRQAKPANMRA